MSELKPCPFCGNQVRIGMSNCVNNQPKGTGVTPTNGIVCDSCRMSIRFIGAKPTAVARWNTRTDARADRAIELIRRYINSVEGDERGVISGERPDILRREMIKLLKEVADV